MKHADTDEQQRGGRQVDQHERAATGQAPRADMAMRPDGSSMTSMNTKD